MPTITEIQKYIARYQKPEEKIDNKKKERVTRQVAANLKQVKPLPQGKCNLCSKESDRLVPVSMKVCPTCLAKFIKRGGEIEVIKKEIVDYNCDYCLARTFTVFYINPKICIFCLKILGRTHKYNLKEVKKHKIKNKQIRNKKIIGE